MLCVPASTYRLVSTVREQNSVSINHLKGKTKLCLFVILRATLTSSFNQQLPSDGHCCLCLSRFKLSRFTKHNFGRLKLVPGKVIDTAWSSLPVTMMFALSMSLWR